MRHPLVKGLLPVLLMDRSIDPAPTAQQKGNFYLTNRGCSCMVNPTEKNKYVDREKVAFQCCRELPLRCEAVRREADVTGPRVAFLSRRFGV